MNVIDNLLGAVSRGEVVDVRVGAFWTAVVTRVNGERRCGLASTLKTDDHHHGGGNSIAASGRLVELEMSELAALARSDGPMEAAIGFATINALLPIDRSQWATVNAEHVIADRGAGKRVALVGHFPFVPELKERVAALWVLEQQPRGDDLPAEAAREVIPQADVLAITGTTLINHTFEGLVALARPDTLVLVLGPTTPLSPVLFDCGVDVLSGAVVEEVDPVVRAVSQGANFRQLHPMGVRLVTMQRSQAG
ncbi:MAG: DUF364 domain-containing protein [Chloroflexi bacterium]|nr:DUF364 domain-containing protein [Chloroflexota bacterium]